MLKWFLKELKIDVNFVRASEQNFVGTKSNLVLDMAKKLNANELYINKIRQAGFNAMQN